MADQPNRIARIGNTIRPICDRFWLFTIAGLALMVIGVIVGAVVINGRMPEGGGELMTSAVTGLLMIVQKVIEAQQQRRMADHLADSSPNRQASGKSDDPVHVTDEAA